MTTPPRKAGKRATSKPPAGRQAGMGNPVFEALSRLSDDEVRALLESATHPDEDQSASELLGRFIELCEDEDSEAEELSEIGSDLSRALERIRIDADGGLAHAAAERKKVLESLDIDIESGVLSGPGLILVAKMLSDSGWPIPPTLKAAAAEQLFDGEASGDAVEGMKASLQTSLEEFAETVDGDSFALCAQIRSMMTALPDPMVAQILPVLLAPAIGVTDLTLAGFVLDREPVLAAAALEALAALDRPVESLLVERLERMRPWLPEARRAPLDAALRKLRPLATPPAAQPPAPLNKILLSGCDGVGSQSAMIFMGRGRRRDVLVALLKRTGVAEIMTMSDLPKREADALAVRFDEATRAAETDRAGILRLLALALSDNLEHEIPPPYELLRVVESLGAPALAPEAADAATLANEILADHFAPGGDAAAIAVAHQSVLATQMIDGWFEASEEISRLLQPLKTRKKRTEAALELYLAGRRAHWARIMARSALALRGLPNKPPSLIAQSLALVARDLLSDRALGEMPLMQAIAKRTVEAFEYNAQNS